MTKVKKIKHSNKGTDDGTHFVLGAAALLGLVAVIVKFFDTETPVLGEKSKKILADKDLLEKYYKAIEKEKKGEKAYIKVDGEEFRVVRAGNYSTTTK